MKKTILACFLASSLAAAAAPGGREVTRSIEVGEGAALVDGTAAKVNGEVVTIGEVLAEAQRDPALRSGADVATAYRRAVNDIVNRRLIVKAAADAKMQLQDWVVDNRVREVVKAAFGGDMSRLRTSLEEAHIDFDDWKREIREDMIVQAMRYQKVERNAAASPGAMRAEYAVHRSRYAKGGSMDLTVTTTSPASPGKPTVKELKGVSPEDHFQGDVARAVRDLKVGESTRPISFGGWTLSVRKDAETPGEQRTFAEAYDDVAAAVREEESERLYREWVARLREAAYVEVFELPADALRQ